MSQGLQCWDENGNLVVDIGDYSIRYIGTYSFRSGSAKSYTITVPGMSSTGWFAYYNLSGDIFNEWSVYCNEGSMTAVYLPASSPPSGTYSFNVYKWDT